VQNLEKDHVEIRFYPPEHRQSLHGALADQIQRSVSPRSWQREREHAWSRAAADRAERKKRK
jgi:hypothetical protein